MGRCIQRLGRTEGRGLVTRFHRAARILTTGDGNFHLPTFPPPGGLVNRRDSRRHVPHDANVGNSERRPRSSSINLFSSSYAASWIINSKPLNVSLQLVHDHHQKSRLGHSGEGNAGLGLREGRKQGRRITLQGEARRPGLQGGGTPESVVCARLRDRFFAIDLSHGSYLFWLVNRQLK